MAVKKENTEAKSDKAYWEEKVPIKLPLNPGNPDDQTVFVSVNNYTAQILRGKEVMVPRYVATVLRQSEEAEMEAFLKRARMSAEYDKDAARYR